MIIDRWLRKLLPREDHFLALFVQDVENIGEACGVLRAMLEAPGAGGEARLRAARGGSTSTAVMTSPIRSTANSA